MVLRYSGAADGDRAVKGEGGHFADLSIEQLPERRDASLLRPDNRLWRVPCGFAHGTAKDVTPRRFAPSPYVSSTA